jgi:hypothetical protein
MVRFPTGLLITNYHPVFYQGKWNFPCDVFEPEKLFVDRYYNFVLEEDHSMMVDGVYCITLGHGMKDNEVVSH